MNINVTDLTFTYPSGVQALQGVTLTIQAGEAVAIVGENGAGKTTLVKHFNGLLRPDGGRVVVGEWDTRQYSVAKLASRVGYVFQNPDDQLFERSVIKEVSFGPRNLGRERRRRLRRRRRHSDRRAATRRPTHPYDLHLSQRKLLALAAVLAMRTPVVVLDEPTTGQDAARPRRHRAYRRTTEGRAADGRHDHARYRLRGRALRACDRMAQGGRPRRGRAGGPCRSPKSSRTPRSSRPSWLASRRRLG